jgi:tetratricopeptide (TPR) repeat protein
MYNEAILKYQDALSLCEPYYVMQCPDELVKQFIQLKIQCVSNLSLCFLNLNEVGQCIERCNEVLRIDPKNVKAYFRLCLAHEKRDDLEDAWANIKKAYQMSGN